MKNKYYDDLMTLPVERLIENVNVHRLALQKEKEKRQKFSKPLENVNREPTTQERAKDYYLSESISLRQSHLETNQKALFEKLKQLAESIFDVASSSPNASESELENFVKYLKSLIDNAASGDSDKARQAIDELKQLLVRANQAKEANANKAKKPLEQSSIEK